MVPDLQGVKVSREETKSTAVEVIEKAIYLIIMFSLLCGGRGYRQDSTGDAPSCLPGRTRFRRTFLSAKGPGTWRGDL